MEREHKLKASLGYVVKLYLQIETIQKQKTKIQSKSEQEFSN